MYTYWDFTQLRFRQNRGMRIDFILGSRKGKAPSDHAPVLIELG